MGRRSRKALSFVLSGLLATSMFTALPGGVARAEELESVPMQSEKRVTENESQMGEETVPVSQGTAQPTEETAQPTELATQTFELVPQNDALPASFDLRAKGLVTPVKIQNPWQSCWAFAGTAAAETSILSMLQEKGQTVDPKGFNLSEKHLAWFALQPVIKQVDQTQVGEGLYTIGQEGDPTAPYDNGGMPVYITTLFSAGVGPVPEENFPYRGSSGLTEKQYYEAHPDEGKAFVSAYYGKNFLQGHTMEEAVAHPNDEPYKSFLDNKIYGEGYLSRDNPLTLDALEDACLRRYLAIQATTNCYTKLDDWSIPALDASDEPNRNLTAGYTLVDGNQLPDTRITEEPANPDDPRVWTGVNWDGVNAIKGELMKGRAVSGTFKADVAVPGAPIPPNSYMNYDTWAHYTHENIFPTHAITIVGWDDDYSASNFREGHLPPGNGAWIVKNSWGSQTDYVTNETGVEIGKADWGVKDESGNHTGYFYISYYDKTLQSCESMSFDTDLHENGEFYVEMYDYMPSMTSSDKDTAEQSDSLVKTANVFKNDAGSYASLRSVSTKTARPNATVKYSVYRLKDGSQNPEDGELLGTKTATYPYAGFHREKLDGSIGLRDGETFSVVAEETVEEGGNTLYEYAVNSADAKEYVTSDHAEGETDYGIAVVNKGESFVYDNGAWTDWSEYEPRTSVSQRYAIDNFSIKAYLVTTTEPKTFPDVNEDDWFYGVASRAVGLGLLNGYGDGNFGPNDGITRGQVAVTLWHMAGDLEPGEGAKSFPDVKAEEYYAKAVSWASAAGVVNGYGNGNFGPNDPVEREQLAAMVANYAREVAGIEVSGSADDYEGMTDADKVSPWAASSVGWCFKSKIMTGTKDGSINPQGGTTRAETAKMVVFLHDLLS